jgi:hypothetical protein
MTFADLDAIARANRVTTPFPHMVIDGVLTENFYRQVLTALPPAETFGSAGFGQLRLDKLQHVPTLAELARVWEEAIAPAVLARFVDLYEHKLGLLFGDDDRVRLQPHDRFGPFPAFVQRRMAGESQQPHVDNAQSLFTCVLYLCDDAADPRDGTTLYSADRAKLVEAYKARREIRAWYPDVASFDGQPMVTVEYRPNRMVAFFSCPYSLHSVRIEYNSIRYSMQAQAEVPQRIRDDVFTDWTDVHKTRAQA